MEAYPDFKELLASFNTRRVDYVIVGGYALALHGAPRVTGDLDLYVRPGQDNAERIIAALADFGFASLGLSAGDFTEPRRTVQLGVPPARVDIVTSIDGVSWDEVDAGKARGHYGEVPVCFIGREELIANKKAVGRQKDKADIEALGEKA